MNSEIPRRVLRFDPEDRAPNCTIDDEPVRCRSPLKKFDPKKWLDAPEFVLKNKVDTDVSGYFAHGDDINSAEFNRFLHDLNSPTNSYALSQEQFLPVVSANPSFMHIESQQPSRPFVPACFPFPRTLVPNGYSANFATINSECGAPIAAIILKKKRKRRHRRTGSQRISIGAQTDFHTKESEQQKTVESSSFNGHQSIERSPAQPINASRLLSVSSDPELFLKMDQSVCVLSNNKSELNGNISGSCPDLSDEQLKLWDDILFQAALDHKTEFITKSRRRTTNSVAPAQLETSGDGKELVKRAQSNTPAMQTSIYEICTVEMEQNEEENCDFNGNVAKSDAHQTDCQENESPISSTPSKSSESPPDTAKERTETQKLAQKLRKELEDLQFRTSYEWQRSDGKVMQINTNPLFEDYPQPNNEFQPTHMSNFDPKRQAFASTSLMNGHTIHPEECQFEADFFENMNIRVNPFEESNDIVLDEDDCPQPSRFQQLQWALQRQKERYNDSLQMPQRVCCNIM